MKLDSIHKKSTGFYVGDKPKNIPTDSLKVIESENNVNRCNVRQFKSGIIRLTGFAVIQFLEGADLFVKNGLFAAINVKSVQLMLKLAKISPLVLQQGFGTIDVDLSELRDLKEWLTYRMQHCEQEREKRTKNANGFEVFNPDTYIGQKLLLLDLRELMIGEILSAE